MLYYSSTMLKDDMNTEGFMKISKKKMLSFLDFEEKAKSKKKKKDYSEQRKQKRGIDE